MSADNTPPSSPSEPPITENVSNTETTSNREGIAIPRDIRSDNLDPATRGEASKILEFNIFEKRTYLFFKITAFIIIILMGAYFLCTGLTVSVTAITHIKDIQVKQLQQNSDKVELAKLKAANNLENPQTKQAVTLEKPEEVLSASVSTQPVAANKPAVPNVEPKKTLNKTSEEKPDKKEPKKDTSDSLGSAMVSTGSIVTLIAFILGVGLTLLLTLLKFTFTANEPTNQDQNDCVTVAGPLSELLQSITNYMKKKFGLN
ncbi:hypothetical protein [Vibrio harveyi]|uniref:hypothetical protein n=1 Tax=Vibrio harveyi TaxID=669 RepID=UPI00237FFE42|nr:hypothetical protein [Vibrio harveyi]